MLLLATFGELKKKRPVMPQVQQTKMQLPIEPQRVVDAK